MSSKNNSELEKEFQESLRTFGVTIQRKLQLANKALVDADAHPAGARALNEACALADEHGIPFHSKVIAIGNHVASLENNYVPDSYFEKFNSLDPNEVQELTSVAAFALSKGTVEDVDEDWDESEEWDSSDEGDGWAPSNVCW